MDLCQKAEAAGVSWITVHGRTAEERHQPVHFDAIKTIKDSLSVPVVANGDIKTLRDVETTHQLTGVDGQFNLCKSQLILYSQYCALLVTRDSKGSHTGLWSKIVHSVWE